MSSPTLALPGRHRMPVERIERLGDEHAAAVAWPSDAMPVDGSRPFTCWSLAPLWHAAIFQELTAPQQLRYNQLVGLMQNELICFFEREFAGCILPALLQSRRALPEDLAASLRGFWEDERRHTAMFRALNRAAAPGFYANADYHILRIPGPLLRGLRLVTRRPLVFPMVFWVMLLMEERSMMISHRYADEGAEIDPRFAATYRAHAEDEVRHVQLDWHLLERFYESRPPWQRRLNAKLLEWFVTVFFLKPRRANVRLVELLIEAFPALEPKRLRLIGAVHGLVENPGYRRMMYSPQATPIGRGLFERLPEFAGLRRILFTGES